MPRADAARTFGPLARFDPHTPDPAHPAVDPQGASCSTSGTAWPPSACEVFGEAGEALICPSWRVALLEPVTGPRLLDLVRSGSAMAIGALPTLSDGALPRSLTREWARAVYEDHPLGAPAAGIRYRSAYNGGIALALWDTARKIRVLSDDSGPEADVPLNHPGMLIGLKTLLMERQIVIRTIPAKTAHGAWRICSGSCGRVTPDRIPLTEDDQADNAEPPSTARRASLLDCVPGDQGKPARTRTCNSNRIVGYSHRVRHRSAPG